MKAGPLGSVFINTETQSTYVNERQDKSLFLVTRLERVPTKIGYHFQHVACSRTRCGTQSVVSVKDVLYLRPRDSCNISKKIQ